MTNAFLTVDQAAPILGLSPKRLRDLIRRDRVVGVTKFGRAYALDPEKMAIVPGKPGRPAGAATPSSG
ncbi:hypothetical protein G3N56_07700 [Desulfovibrio sulfodismutans]|uniref:Helix-turn-helix domain-containing protein n=1 Tax=Desulfolutivibrio sulfodismutans TaxID=63561 RepID=A0A7K3NK95_9BACT|nr:hypothetical protein [Desulfolutivibrio sulfodismutans]NDY56626.1 hypothetical protein [Desulfolutivibrio sulfodismutans]QLA11273.1 hypothetical protein GD606_02755 [Desulfolutivibrio sulfodismutans DSM 3696]